MKPPCAPKYPKKIVQHDEARTDNYHWLRDKNWQKFLQGDLNFDNSEVKAYLEAEASYTESVMASTQEQQNKFYQEILGRIKEDDETYPFERNGYFYFQRTTEGKNYPQLFRKKGSLEAKEELYFDVNQEAEGKKLYLFSGGQPNDNNQWLAYSFNLTGSMEKTLKVRDLSTGKDFPWEVKNCTGSFMWANNEEIYFVERGPEGRGQKIFLFRVDKGPESKELIFEKPESCNDMFMSISKSKTKKVHFVYMASGSETKVYYKWSTENKFKLFSEGKNDVDFSIDHRDGCFYIRTNHGQANNYQIYKCSESNVQFSNWQIFINEQNSKYLTDFAIYGSKMLLMYKNNETAVDEVSILDLNDKTQKKVSMSEPAYTLSYSGAFDPQSTKVRFYYESCRQPSQVLDLDLLSGQFQVLKSKEVPNFNPDNYVLKREYAKGHDGEMIPLSILYKKGFKEMTNKKAFVYAYGSYGLGMPAFFSPGIFSLVDRGFVSVIAHIRGGDEKGFDWYLSGKKQNKMNTFKDYISSCEYMISQGYVKAGDIVANGGSAGGMLMGAVANMRPELFRCVIADVPFVDVINTISDETLPLTPPEWEEWGNPILNKKDYQYMMSYSPYDNIEKKEYPSMLYNSGISDEQVTYWEPAKMVAKLRELKTDNNTLLLNIKMHAGHVGASKRYEAIKERAFNFAFIMKSFSF